VRPRGQAIITGTDGFTLPELLVALLLGLVVIGAGVTVVTASLNNQPRLTSRTDRIQEARTTMERITRELRQGSSVTAATSSQLTLLTYVHRSSCGGGVARSSIVCRVTYTCTAGTCTRTEAQPNGSSPGPAVQVVSGLSNGIVFVYTPPASSAPAYVTVTLSFPAQGGDDAITLGDGAALRNPSAS
jgi:prepilin-type N-terminal cleavage/methylation domain-containing protein